MAMIHPIYRKLYALYYEERIPDNDRITPEWLGGILRELQPRAIYTRIKSPDLVIFTDAATSAMIMASDVFR